MHSSQAMAGSYRPLFLQPSTDLLPLPGFLQDRQDSAETRMSEVVVALVLQQQVNGLVLPCDKTGRLCVAWTTMRRHYGTGSMCTILMHSYKKSMPTTKERGFTALHFLEDLIYCGLPMFLHNILCSMVKNYSTVGFVIGFSTFLLGCIDYSSLRRHSHSQLSDVIVPHCVSRYVVFSLQSPKLNASYRFSGFTLLFFLLFTAFYIWQIISYVLGIQRLVDMYKFYTYLLKIPDVSLDRNQRN